jgi:hypothetical protein
MRVRPRANGICRPCFSTTTPKPPSRSPRSESNRHISRGAARQTGGPGWASREPPLNSRAGATAAFRDAWRDARCSRYRAYRPAEQQCQAPGKPRPEKVCAKCGAGGVGLLGIVVRATTFVARLAVMLQ